VLPQAALALVCGLALFLILAAGFVIGYSVYHAGRIFPGVSVAGVDLSGLAPVEAGALLADRLTFPETGRIVFQEGQTVWSARPVELGLFLDPQNSAMAAYHLGRTGNPLRRLSEQLHAWYSRENLPPILVYDERVAQRYLEGLAAQINRPTVEAALAINGAEIIVTPGQIGRTLIIAASLPDLEAQLRSQTDGLIPLVVRESPPVILDAGAQAEIARKILSEPLVLRLPEPQEGEPGPWTFEPDKLAGMLTIERVEEAAGAQYQVGIKADSLRPFLEGLAPGLARQTSDARFIFNDETRQLEAIQPSSTGRTLDVEATLQSINARILQGEHDIPLEFSYIEPRISDKATGEELGIRELVSQQTSYFYGSSKARLQNIATAAARFHGILVPPGATFSMAEALGDVSLDTGYAEALIIFGDRTIEGVGGGVCQVSTTLFRTVFFGGYPIVERHPHAYRVGYYELTANGNYDADLAGLDATVFVPVVDFRFTNDTPNWLLMETYVEGYSLTWKFYSTSEGRTVEWDTTGLRNMEDPPEPVYQENPELAEGEINQVDWEVAGGDVSVTRTVYRGGEVYIQDHYGTHYVPWRAVYEYGPGTKIPKNKRNGDE
jgi:vancomycin resistance protein YoaR